MTPGNSLETCRGKTSPASLASHQNDPAGLGLFERRDQLVLRKSCAPPAFGSSAIWLTTEGLGTTSKYGSYHLELFGMLTVNSVRDLSLNEPLPIEALPRHSDHLTIWQILDGVAG